MSDRREFSTRVFVGVDIGMTFTGVAFGIDRNPNASTRDFEMHVIERWPGNDLTEKKVPTKVAYTAGEIGKHSWGFECPELEYLRGGQAVKDMFKFYLDTDFAADKLGPGQTIVKPENVRLWYTDFLTALHAHIIDYLPRLKVDKDFASIEYVFSIPTKWKGNDNLLRLFRDIVDDAGFGNNVRMDLTEGEAAAVFTSDCFEREFQEGQTFIVFDAGGGTTDMCAFLIKSIQNKSMELQLLAEPQALPAGSVYIDDKFETKIKDLLRFTNGVVQSQIDHLALKLTRGQFQPIKAQFGTTLTRLPSASFRIPGSSEKVSFPYVELEVMFDSQVKIMTEAIDKQVAALDSRVSYLVLAGGLGSSKYVQDRLIEHCAGLGIRVLFPEEPDDLPLAVCKGLIIDRVHNARHNCPVIPIRNSSSSYGILYKEPYGEKHNGQLPVIDELDGRSYAVNQIDWLVGQGLNHFVSRPYSIFAKPDIPEQSWVFTVVRSTSDSRPTFLDTRGNVEVIGHVVSTPQVRLYEHGIAQRRGYFPRRSIFSRVNCRLSVEIEAGKFEFKSEIAGRPGPTELVQTLKVQWSGENKGSDLVSI